MRLFEEVIGGGLGAGRRRHGNAGELNLLAVTWWATGGLSRAFVGSRGRRRVALTVEDLKEERVINACGECPSTVRQCVTAWVSEDCACVFVDVDPIRLRNEEVNEGGEATSSANTACSCPNADDERH
jgi:hypothetical protein